MGGRVVQGGSLRCCSLRRRGFEPHPMQFFKIFFKLKINKYNNINNSYNHSNYNKIKNKNKKIIIMGTVSFELTTFRL